MILSVCEYGHAWVCGCLRVCFACLCCVFRVRVFVCRLLLCVCFASVRLRVFARVCFCVLFSFSGVCAFCVVFCFVLRVCLCVCALCVRAFCVLRVSCACVCPIPYLADSASNVKAVLTQEEEE